MTDRLGVVAGLLLALLFFVFIYYGKPESSSVAFGKELEQEDVQIVQAIELPEPSAYYDLTAEERDLIERVVMGEAGGEEYMGQQAVAQCILNDCEINNARPAEIVDWMSYTTHRPQASQSVKDAVSDVFDDGAMVLPETAMYFYAPDMVYSAWHESQIYLDTIGCHKFFARAD